MGNPAKFSVALAKEINPYPRYFLHLFRRIKSSNIPSDFLASLPNEGLFARIDGESLQKAYVFTRTLID